MQEKGKRFITEYGFRLSVFAALFFLFMLLGHDGPAVFDDSGSYMRVGWHEGVMPVYPLFLMLNECLFGFERYLWPVITEQALLAAFSVTVLAETVRARFGLHPAEEILLCLAALYPYTIEMPVLMSQAILTEGISYSLFYLFLAVLLTAVWDKSYARLAGAFAMTLLLSAVRSQLQILFGVCGIVFLYLVCMRRKEAGRGKKAVRFLAGLAGCMAVSAAGVLLVLGMTRGYQILLQEEHLIGKIALEVQWPRIEKARMEEEKAEEENREKELPDIRPQEKVSGTESVTSPEVYEYNFRTSQYMTLIFSRGMYEADYEDAALFQDPVLKGLYLALYEAVDAEGQRYAYADEGLWMWKDIVGGIGKIGGICFWIPSMYYMEYEPEIILSDQFSDIRYSHLMTIGFTLIKAHWGRFFYHTAMLLPQAFISTVFFQFAPLYGFCHVVTAFLYLSAAALMIWGYVDARGKKEAAEMMALVLGINVVMVFVISLVFFGQQRYLVYAFGPFYIAYYLLLRHLWQARGRELFRRRFCRERET